jgi:hypothetical protein
MKNLLKKWRQRREEKRKLRELKQLSSAFAAVERLQTGGLLSWDVKNRRLLITEPLALIFMQTAEKWQAFIQNVYLYTYHQQCAEAWEQYMQKEELAAVREAMADLERVELSADGKTQKQHSPNMSREDIDRIRRARRAEIVESDMQPPRVEGFEFFIVADTTDAQPKLLAVGHFDPDTDSVEMASWEEVSRFLKK